MDSIQKYAKAIVAFVGAFLTAGSTFIPAEWSPWVSLVLALLTTIATYQVPNKPAVSTVDASQPPVE